ncbi:MAG: hypothetical protein HQL97_13655, partial [Magnetococcales bacterium]|nr:hypothetical protein [Magnetococcales bacterium]
MANHSSSLDIRPHTFIQDRDCPPGLLDTLTLWQAQPAQRPPFLQLLERDTELQTSRLWADRFRARAERLVVLGIGGSSLGGNMLVSTLVGPGSGVTFLENICPEQLAALYDLDWKATRLLAISKSGETPETLAQLLTVLPVLEARLGRAALADHLAVVTENPASALGAIATTLGVPIIPHAAVGGRFSVLSVTGLLPAAFAGIDIDALVAGARSMAEGCLLPDAAKNPALRHALAQAAMATAGRNMSVLLTYGSRLETIATWFRQLWAESLGKIDPQGRKQGLTPVEARGVVDQHSQLQLYLDGPEDKQFTLLFDPTLAQAGRVIDAGPFAALPAIAPLAGRS